MTCGGVGRSGDLKKGVVGRHSGGVAEYILTCREWTEGVAGSGWKRDEMCGVSSLTRL